MGKGNGKHGNSPLHQEFSQEKEEVRVRGVTKPKALSHRPFSTCVAYRLPLGKSSAGSGDRLSMFAPRSTSV